MMSANSVSPSNQIDWLTTHSSLSLAVHAREAVAFGDRAEVAAFGSVAKHDLGHEVVLPQPRREVRVATGGQPERDAEAGERGLDASLRKGGPERAVNRRH